ncbi:hypothetical protein FDK38_001247 [Candidozyma auris]|nr:hypothetical protein FDK38_001247 [[Candida] auris]
MIASITPVTSRTLWCRLSTRPILSFVRFASSVADDRNYYQILELPRNASIKDIKAQFRKLSKKYHPDLNSHLSDEKKELNNKKYVQMSSAYDTLKDVKAKREYDAKLGFGGRKQGSSHNPNHSDWENKYYGEAKYYSKAKASGSYFSRGYSNRRHRVHNFYNGSGAENTNSHFSGIHRNYGDRYSVPHFDYNTHLAKHLKFEQRILGKQLTPEDRDVIIGQLRKEGNGADVSEELITKHLMRHAHGNYQANTASSSSAAASNPYMYQGPQHGGYHDDSMSLGMTTGLVLGGLGSIYLIYYATT